MIIEGDSVPECWLNILNELVVSKKQELSPLIAKINITDNIPVYRDELENDLNNFLTGEGQPCIETTAGTIFPVSLSGGSASVFNRFEKIWKYVKTDSKNRKGTYFRRLTAYGEKYGRNTNQLKHIIETYNGTDNRNPVHRRSALIATTFDPTLDHTPQPQLGFPCLQQVCFIPSEDKLSMNAIYAMQHLSTRAYGNYLGLIRLGQFMAKEMGLEFVQLNCMISVLGLGKMKKQLASKLIEKYI